MLNISEVTRNNEDSTTTTVRTVRLFGIVVRVESRNYPTYL